MTQRLSDERMRHELHMQELHFNDCGQLLETLGEITNLTPGALMMLCADWQEIPFWDWFDTAQTLAPNAICPYKTYEQTMCENKNVKEILHFFAKSLGLSFELHTVVVTDNTPELIESARMHPDVFMPLNDVFGTQFAKLPADVMYKVTAYLTPAEMARMAKTCRKGKNEMQMYPRAVYEVIYTSDGGPRFSYKCFSYPEIHAKVEKLCMKRLLLDARAAAP